MTPTPRTDAIVDQCPQPGQPPGIQWPEIVPAEFARELERELATAREALEWARMQLGKHTRPSPIDKALNLAAALPTHQDCPVENHAVVVAAMEALAMRPPEEDELPK